MIVLLDAGPLGIITHQRRSPEVLASRAWLRGLLRNGREVLIPEIVDYELRRELIRLGFQRSIRRLDRLGRAMGYLPLDTDMMRRAAELWAQARARGQQTAGDQALDAEMILCAQADVLEKRRAEPVVIATRNIGHLGLFADARDWQQLT